MPGGGGCSHWEAYTHARTDRVLLSQLYRIQNMTWDRWESGSPVTWMLLVSWYHLLLLPVFHRVLLCQILLESTLIVAEVQQHGVMWRALQDGHPTVHYQINHKDPIFVTYQLTCQFIARHYLRLQGRLPQYLGFKIIVQLVIVEPQTNCKRNGFSPDCLWTFPNYPVIKYSSHLSSYRKFFMVYTPGKLLNRT